MTTVVNNSAVDVQLSNLLDEFKSLLRKGQGIPVREFARQYPYFSDRILAEFPALLMAEGLVPRTPQASESGSTPETEPIPKLPPEYRVIRQISKCETRAVYEAEHPKLLRRLAIITFPACKKGPGTSEQFRRAAKAASCLSHPNIIPVHDFGEVNGIHYLTTSLIEGISLERLMEEYRANPQLRSNGQPEDNSSSAFATTDGQTVATDAQAKGSRGSTKNRIPPLKLIGPTADFRRLAKLGADVAAALAHAHSAGTIHGDIRPGNLILSKDGKIWVANFGVAKADEDKSDRSRIISDNAKSKFVALDQMRSTGDARSDVQSLGMTLYEMASGKQAWASLNTSQLLKVRAGTEPLDLTEQSPFVPKPLAEIIMKACSSRPEDRYQSAREFEVVLSRFAQGEKVPDRRRRPRHKSTKFDRRWIVASTAFGVPAAVYLLIGLYSLLWKATEDVASTELPVTRVVLNTGDDKAAAQRPNEKTNRETSIVSRIQPGADEASDRVTQLMNKVIDAQRQSGDGETSDRITELMNQVIDAQRQSGDRETSDRITELMNQVIDAQRQSGDGETSDRITELMEAMIKKSEVTSKTPKTAANDLGKTNNGDGFTYDEMDHPLTNAVRNLDLSRQVSSLRLSTADKLSSQAKIAALGEAIRRTLINEKQIHDLLSYLPPEAQTRKINEEISDPMLISFLLALHRTFEIARSNLADSQQFMQHEKLKEALRPVDNLKKARHRTSE